MSAFLVSNRQLNVLATLAAEVGLARAGEAFITLTVENLRSLYARYGRAADLDAKCAGQYVFERADLTAYRSVALLKLVHCYDYQACEDRGYEASKAKALVEGLIQFLEENGAREEQADYNSAQWAL